MNYEELTEDLIDEMIAQINLGPDYAEFIHAIVEFDEFQEFNPEKFKKYIDEKMQD